ncbi:hypothetical protein HDU86_002023 [Geranomyces michiganensis]|nr:hypothetical protein HDU86_002023 [Geranomyces michiganensis]
MQPPLSQPAQQSQHQRQIPRPVTLRKMEKLTSSDNITAAAAEADAVTAGHEHDSPEPDPSKRVKGLRHFSRCVAEKVQAKGSTTYNEVADELVDEFTMQARNADSFDHKNIRRRVYDALNVLMAMGIIVRAKKEIRWIGLPTEGSYQRDLEALQVSIIGEGLLLRNKLEQTKRGSLCSDESLGTIIGPGEASESLMLPFLLLRSAGDAQVKIENNDDRSQFMISFSKPFHMVKDMEVVSTLCDGVYEANKYSLASRGSALGSSVPYPTDPNIQNDPELYQQRVQPPQQKSSPYEMRNPTGRRLYHRLNSLAGH